MNLFTLPLRYARVKWLRTLLLVAVLALGVASMTGLRMVSTHIGESFEKKLISYGANILVTPQRETLTVSYGGYTMGDITLEEHKIDLPTAEANIAAMPLRGNISVIAPKLIAPARYGNQTVAMVGVRWQAELALKAYWEVTGTLPATTSTHEVLLGATLAHKLNLHPGQNIELAGQTLHITGVLKAIGNEDDTVIFAALPLVQEITGQHGQAAFLEVAALCSGCPIDDIVEQLQHVLPATDVRALRQVAESRMYAIHFAQNLAFYVSLVILITACAMMIVSMLSAVTERRKEIGIMRAVGFSRNSVFIVFVTEAFGIGLLAGLLGHGAGFLVASSVLEQLQLGETTQLSMSVAAFFATAGTVALAAGIAAAFPAWKASLVEPANALVAL